MTLEMLIAFGFSITHMPNVDTQFVRMIRARTEVAATAVYDVTTRGYLKDGAFSKVEAIFTYDAAGKLLTPEEAAEATQKLVMNIAFHESAYNQKAHRIVDGSNDCGLMQVKPMWISKFVPGIGGCEAAKEDPKLAIYVGMKTLAFKKAECLAKLPPDQQKNAKATFWLGAYASGTCGFAQVKARELCERAGVCDYK